MKTFEYVVGKKKFKDGGRFTESPRKTGHLALARAYTAYGQAKANNNLAGIVIAEADIKFLKSVKPSKPEEEN